MGNISSSWFNQRTSQPTNGDRVAPNRSDSNTSPYNFRRTISRIRRRRHPATSSEDNTSTPSIRSLPNLQDLTRTLNNDNPAPTTSPLTVQQPAQETRSSDSNTSLGSRRSFLEMLAGSRETDARNIVESQRPRLEELRNEVFTPEPEDQNSLFFYFPLPIDDEGSNAPSTNTQQDSSDFNRPTQIVLVRLRHVAPTATSISSPSDASQEPTNAADLFQWTMYFIMPRREDENGNVILPPVAYEPNVAAMRAFNVLRAIMSGENMTFEDWTRLQETLGDVNRGLSRETIEKQLAAIKFADSMTSSTGCACPICLADYIKDEQLRTLPCLHSFHADCIDVWLGKINSCPLCRQQPVAHTTPSPTASPDNSSSAL